MATLQYSFLPLVKYFLVYSSSLLLLVLLFLCFPEKSQASQIQFQTLDISSHHLRASLCTSASITAGSKNRRPSTLKLVSRHGPCAPQPTTSPTLTKILSYDQLRVKSIQALIKSKTNITNQLIQNPNKAKSNNEQTDLPALSGLPLESGNYIVIIALGTPQKNLSLIFDTASDLTWTRCQPCVRSCYPHLEPIFNPTDSSSYFNISCNSTQCSQLTSAAGHNPSCSSTGTCVYGIIYGDGSFSLGFLAKENITLTSTDVFPNFLFGCGQNNQGLFGSTAGILGLGRGPLSFVSQTTAKYGKYFSYCLPSSSSSTGFLTFGKKNETNSTSNVKFTPFASSRDTQFYFINIISISVGGTRLPISQSVFRTIIDSGTVITRLPSDAYVRMRDEFQKHMGNYPTAPSPFKLFDTCFDTSNHTNITVPTVSFTFSRNVTVDFDPSGILVAINPKVVCLAFAGNTDPSYPTIFGNTQQKTLEVVYDVAGRQLGFGPGGCP